MDLYDKTLQYRYDDGWEYRTSYSAAHIDYEVIDGPAKGRTSFQDAEYAQVATGIFVVAWYEETGAVVSTTINLNTNEIFGFVTVPRWVADDPHSVALDKKTHLDELLALRDKGKDSPRSVALKHGKVVDVTGIATSYRL